MSRRPSKCSNTGSSEVASSSRRGGRRAPPSPVEDEEERIDPDADEVPVCKYGIRAVPAHAQRWFQKFIPAVTLEPEVAIDDGKSARKYSEIYNNIRALGFDSLFRPGDAVNVTLVKEFYANWQPEASLDAVYEVQVRGKVIPFSSQVINRIMGFTEHSHKLFQRFLRRPNYPAIRRLLCGTDSSTAWARDANEFHKDMKKITFQRPARVVLRLINAKITPTQSDTDVPRLKVCLIYALLTRMWVDLRKLMLEHMARVRPLGARRLYYSSMITRLLRAHYVEEEFHYDRTIPVTYPIKAYDVTSVIDPPATAVNSDLRLVRVEETLQLLFADLSLRAARGEADLEELQQDHPLSAITQQWLRLARGGQLPPEEDVNTIPSNNEEYLRTFEDTMVCEL
ncbi:hypothetical protein A4A49_22426 [Nicotiana attenuata]|uniref:Putative plant transposon protein domain-containing protein n=1 Tax=Nicotiana attenuata TaxID=49451 RepID=A0A1J6IEB7_NICAT|nr:hypothetical protein A4A49_22426 [Nicotiana attenuata]